MKINNKVRSIYAAQFELNSLLEEKVKSAFEGRKRPAWFFTCRLKALESFAQKLETGRIEDPNRMEDFFACTFVVENRTTIKHAVEMVEQVCNVIERRPKREGKTHKSSDSFPFDDLRLYVTLKEDDSLPESPVSDIKFEIQIKTFLQHAWGIATHDLVYKGQNVDWGRARVAYQIKAMLEHAEISVEQVDRMAESTVLAVTDKKTEDQKKLINWFSTEWESELLPKNLVRLADTVRELTGKLEIDIDSLLSSLAEDKENGTQLSLNYWSPHSVIIKSIYNHYNEKLTKFLKSRSQTNFRIFIDDPELAAAFKSFPKLRYLYVGPDN